MKTLHKEFNVETGEETLIERDETEQERKERETSEAEAIKVAKEIEAKAAARQAILDRLGLTEEEARLLLG